MNAITQWMFEDLGLATLSFVAMALMQTSIEIIICGIMGTFFLFLYTLMTGLKISKVSP